MVDFDISRASGTCCVSGRVLKEDEEFFTVILETPDALARRDYSLEAWSGPPEGTLCFFKTRMPLRHQPKRRFIDDGAMVGFFKALADTSNPGKQKFRFVLALILLRKRLLKYERTLREADTEIWEMRLVKEKTSHRVLNPVLREDEIQSVSAELSTILHGFVVDQIESPEAADTTHPSQAPVENASPAPFLPTDRESDDLRECPA